MVYSYYIRITHSKVSLKMNINRQQYIQVILRHSKYYEVHSVSIISIISVFDNTDSINPSLIEINSIITVPEIASSCAKCTSFLRAEKNSLFLQIQYV